MKRTIAILAITSITVTAMSTAPFLGAFKAKYNPKAGGVVASAGCKVCHATAKGGKLNAYGMDVKAAAKGGKVTAAVLAAVEGKDSNKDGVKNGDAIKADKLP